MFSSFGSFIMMSMGGGGPHGFGHSSSHVGADFDEYTRRVIHEPFNEDGIRTLDDFWKFRKCRIYSTPDSFRTATVISWTQERAYFGASSWSIELEWQDGFQVGDAVVISKRPKKHDGKNATIVKELKNGKFKVKLDNDDLEFVTVEQKYLRKSTTTYSVHRMNIDGGGTIKKSQSETLISLEWVDASSPTIDLDEGTLRAICPTCRAVEPLVKAYDEEDNAPTIPTNNEDREQNQVTARDGEDTASSASTNQEEQEQDCPICMETTSCRTLECTHTVCHTCWKTWIHSSPNVPVAAPEISEQELQRTRDYSYQRLRAMLPHSLGGTASKPTDSEAIQQQVCENAESHVESVLETILREEEGGSDENGRVGLRQFWKRILTCSIHIFCMESSVAFLVRRLSVTALEIFLRVVQERQDELYTGLQQIVFSRVQHGADGMIRGYIYSLKCKCCNQLGESQEEDHNYRAGVPWYERSLLYAKKRLQADTRHTLLTKQAVSTQHCNLGLAQKRAGFLNKANDNYNKSLTLYYSEDVAKNKETLLEEMKQWTGTSKRLSPGC